MSAELLVLFDLDGTLLLDDAYTHGRAMVRAMRDVYGVSLPDGIVHAIDPWGKTDRRIARDALRTAGLDDHAIDREMNTWMAVAEAIFLEEAASWAQDWVARPGLEGGVTELGERGMRLALVTGNLRRIALTKLDLLGVASHFELQAGAYGSDHEERRELIPIARRRAGRNGGSWTRERTVVVGDTPGDASAASADSVACIRFRSARFPDDRLAGADALVSDMRELVGVLASWQQAGRAARQR
jgi:phosphoglycolate phosphatase